MSVLEALVLAETVALALLGVVVVALLRSHGEVLRTLHRIGAGAEPDGPPVAVDIVPRPQGLPAAPIVGVTLDDEAVSWPVVGRRDVLLAFLSGGCETCLPFWSGLAEAAAPVGVDLLVVTRGPERESETLLRRLAPRDVPVVMSSAAWEDYDVPGSPHFVYVDGASGTVVGEGTAPTWPQVVALLERAAGDGRLAARRGAREGARPGPADKDEPVSVDAELAAAGVILGDPRLYTPPTEAPADRS